MNIAYKPWMARLFKNFFSNPSNYNHANQPDSIIWLGTDGLFLLYPEIFENLRKIARHENEDMFHEVINLSDDHFSETLIEFGMINRSPTYLKSIVITNKNNLEQKALAIQFIDTEFKFGVRELPVTQNLKMIRAL